MSKQIEGIRRMLLILNRIRMAAGKFVSQDELMGYVNEKMTERYGYTPIVKRTLQRDIQDIGELFHIYISYNRTGQGYFIEEDHGRYKERINELIMNFDLLNAIDRDTYLSSYILAEHHRPLYSEWLIPLTKAIKETHPVRFEYVNYRKDNATMQVEVKPHYLKESNQRWYLLAYDGAVMKTYGVDRIRHLEILEQARFNRNMDIDVTELFKDCYGIWNDPTMPIEDIELRYSPLDGRFIKSAPIHSSQKVLADNDNEFRISLRLRITNDFVMELLSRSNSLEVIRPQHLRERIRKIYEEALKRNS
ncbi:MAG: WYL domain-containing protein [Prevotella sp.]|nr:WYL domain-containing protein [Prevotella sp.]